MLFVKGNRPDPIAITAFASRQQIVAPGHDFQNDAALEAQALPTDQPVWVELLRDGLTFDLCGLAPGPTSAFPEIAHRFDLPVIPSAEAFDAVAILRGPHLTSRGRTMPVARGMLALACDLIRYFESVAAVSWTPSRSAIGRRFFESVTAAWLEGGPFPALGLTAFEEAPDGALQSVGLHYWIGQELRIEPPLCADKVAATRLGTRIVNHLVIVGGIGESERIIAPDGTRLVLRSSRDRAVISVWRE